ncbi:MAG: hypothetical protein HY291_04720 [Planctomycetes bacterium]|nr:hypothetical protein [Planctomycetota bacterium]
MTPRTTWSGLGMLGIAILLCPLASARGEEEKVRTVPASDTLTKDSDLDHRKLEEFINVAIAAHEKTAMAEFQVQRKKVEADLAKLEEERQDRERRRLRYKEMKGDTSTTTEEEKPPVVYMRVDFKVPELSMYRDALESCKKRGALAQSILEMLPSLDKDKDGQLAGDEYRAAAAIVRCTDRILRGLDSNKDGVISQLELDASKSLPKDSAEAKRMSSSMVDAKDYRIPRFDADKDGVLDTSERKALSVAYSSAAIQYLSEAAMYERIVKEFEARERTAALKFQSLEVRPVPVATTAEKPKP